MAETVSIDRPSNAKLSLDRGPKTPRAQRGRHSRFTSIAAGPLSPSSADESVALVTAGMRSRCCPNEASYERGIR